jgi:hypothetical protein
LRQRTRGHSHQDVPKPLNFSSKQLENMTFF